MFQELINRCVTFTQLERMLRRKGYYVKTVKYEHRVEFWGGKIGSGHTDKYFGVKIL